ncbi:MAG: ATP-binding cassette domain-containing protein [Propionicimonas sp.]|uniref:ATP-binding cassette domain-containing protein n=1 Tax=Propionicimonas sp. TaxID=1955623 RepID=UPI003D0EBE0F
MVGAGRSEVARAVFGVDPYESGQVRLDGDGAARSRTPTRRCRRASRWSRRIGASRASSSMRRRDQHHRRDPAQPDEVRTGHHPQGEPEAQLWARKLEVKTAALDAVAGTLSGGNQQKVVLAKWLAANPKVLIIDEPTRGIDVGTKSEVHRMMSELAGMGLAILMISSELPEVLGMADRVLVMHEGRITADIPRAEATPETVMFAATHTNEEAL